ncbi:IS3 family transposase [Dyadobacter frigoris]
MFQNFKNRMCLPNKFVHKKQAAVIVFEYIEIWYNKKRLPSALG